jgi:hypothetical protein
MTDLQDLQDLEDLEVEKIEPLEKPLQKLKIKKGEKSVMEDAVINEEPPKKQKKPRTEKQLEVFTKAREKMLLNLKERKEKQEQDAIIKKKEIEEKIIKKAVAIKKREIKQKAILEEISDDDTPIEEVKKIATKIAVKKAVLSEGKALEPEPPKNIFQKYKFI